MKDFRIVVLGSGGVGKSALTLRFVQDLFFSKYDPSIEDTYHKSFLVDGQPCSLQIVDTAGIETYSTMRNVYPRSPDAFIFVYAINNFTFNDIPEIHQQALRVKDSESVPGVLIGPKCDLVHERTIPTEKGEEMAKKLGISFYETSALTGQNVEAAFADLVRQIRKVLQTHVHEGRHSNALGCSMF